MTEPSSAVNPEKALLETGRLWLRLPEEGDLPLFERLFCDAKMMHYLGEPWTLQQAEETLREWGEGWGSNRCWYGVIVRKDSGEAAGIAGFSEDTIPDQAGMELALFVLPEHQGQGFAAEIARELQRFAFEELGAQRVLGDTHPENPASNRVLEKLGFRCAGEQHHHYDYLPGFDRQAMWELTREMWEAGVGE